LEGSPRVKAHGGRVAIGKSIVEHSTAKKPGDLSKSSLN